ncbi:hypothetical protein [Geosporobacter ferrireducens]|uniref:Uncharacterized protein n=1 Tax=Geosporobacter ferrireducens TaxID=1424294 RepID=A0A1D8GM85_9FIRM|nr:hypothetical protein [Geosporobacter ferrireducens]AOT71902.1 hypothetical protein Gferi_21610 [Geosporobacter ferrireducens]MTI55693.1 hypothetical protein [Geosporobacter ferrireducens]
MKTTTKFISLIENLNVNLVVFVENDFTPLADPEEILSYLVDVNQEDIKSLLSETSDNGYAKLTVSLEEFLQIFKSVEHEVDLKEKIVETGKITKYLDKMENKHELYIKLKKLAKEIIDEINLINEKEAALTDIFLKYGAVNQLSVYSAFFEELKKVTPRKSLRIYKEAPIDEWDNIETEITRVTKKSEFCLCIVDKRLGLQQSGEDFIKNCLYDLRRKCNIVSVLYTSYREKKEPTKLYDYFTIQIDKEGENTINELTEGLAFCAYVTLFEKLSEIHSKSINDAFKLALARRKNMNYIANMAHEEGITAFEAVSKWFDLVKEESLTETLISKNNRVDFSFLVGLTYFLNEEFLNDMDKQVSIDLEEDMQYLNTFEIFDYTVNSQHLPPSPGDIFQYVGDTPEFKGKYLILVGQDCDSVIRGKKLSRKVKSAEFIIGEANKDIINEKVDQQELVFQYFRSLDNDEVGSLKINTKQRVSADFAVVDTCAYNADGTCMLNIVNDLDKQVSRLLPPIWNSYYNKLQEVLISTIDISNYFKDNSIPYDLIYSNDISVFEYTDKQGVIIFPLKRICRLRGKFKELITKNYWDYRSRAGINTIPITNTIKFPIKKLQYGYPGNMYSKSIDIDAYIVKTNDREKNKKLSKLQMLVNIREIVDEIKDDFNISFELCEDIISIENNKPYEDKLANIRIEKIVENDIITGLKITFPYIIIHNNNRIFEEEIKITKILNKTIISKKIDWYYLSNEEKADIYDEKDRPKRFKINEILSRGIYNPDLNIKIHLDNGKIIIEQESLAAVTK